MDCAKPLASFFFHVKKSGKRHKSGDADPEKDCNNKENEQSYVDGNHE